MRCLYLSVIVFVLSFSNLLADDLAWDTYLKTDYFGESEIIEDDSIMVVDGPGRAENGAIVPIRLDAKIKQTDALYIKTVTLFIDNNPEPLVGVFHFTPFSGEADLALRVRVNAYSNMRIIAETSDGKLHMNKQFIKASGGCSAPANTDFETAFKRMGKMKFKVDSEVKYKQSKQVQIAISHPNATGLEMNQETLLYEPAHYVRKIKVTFNDEVIFWADTGISISENPNFRFYFEPEKKGKLVAHMKDSKGLEFTKILNL